MSSWMRHKILVYLVSLAPQENLSNGIGEYLNFILLVSLATEKNTYEEWDW